MSNERDIVFSGIKLGEHSFNPENMMEEIRTRAVEAGKKFVYFRPQGSLANISEDYILKWVKYLSDNEIYFFFGNTVQAPPEGKKCQLTKELVSKIKEVAGTYFLGDAIREPGTTYAAKARGYFKSTDNSRVDPGKQKTDSEDMEEAHSYYLGVLKNFASTVREFGMPNVLTVEATALIKYAFEAGIDIPILEVMCGSPDDMLPSARGAVRAYGKDFFATLIAHEWYGGFKHSDTLKRKRLELAAKFIYMQGTGVIMLESGDEAISSYDQKHSADSEICEDYRRTFKSIGEFIKNDFRPKGGPKTKFAFISGLHDAWAGFGQSSVWNQFDRAEWGHAAPEYSWRILNELGKKRKWGDNTNYGDCDESTYPAYGTYDILPIEAPIEVMEKYDYLVFLGYNTMTDENLDKLTEYVRRGGKLLLSGAHLNYSVKRKGEFIPPNNERLEALCGVRFNKTTKCTNHGVKFALTSLEEKHLYPGTSSFVCDPLYSAGYVEYMDVEPTTAKVLAMTSDSFSGRGNEPHIAIVENPLGKGLVTFVASIDYPGAPALYPLYLDIVREMISSSARNCEIRVIAPDKLRYTVYEGNKIYLLNTDYDLPITVKIIYDGKERTITLESLELKAIEL